MHRPIPVPGLLALCALPLLAGCVSGNKIRASGEVIHSDIERAKKSGAYRCAPRELALAEANLDFALGEVSEGSSVRAQDHIRVAEDNIKKALVLSKDCGPKQVLIRDLEPTKPPVVVKIEETDRDKDGVLDREDACPDEPGPAENKGCPWGDKDKDGVADNIDKCPEIPGPADNQGCPREVKDTDGDGIPDNTDSCPLDPGPVENKGCPWGDKDGDGLKDNVDRCPDLPGPAENQGCPWGDKDADGVTDNVDKCPEVPGPADNQGCPWGDKDSDGVTDNIDRCPEVPGPADNQGCPKYKLVVVKAEKIEIKQQVHFAFGKATILRDSFALLNQVGQVLHDYPKIKKVRIEGHTDSVGGAASNLKLSQKRADAVRDFLIDKAGLDPTRLESVGYGKERPIASNATERGRAQNRRTEFNITEQGE